ncbi:hypothetical protein Tsp_06847 [Trichinella spiralis]|uniref:hypothetical protein n=1 Tax=Trichinella spiralis TaxID=6334 RepID=UPI0001EFC9D4|nr:hypothetical protein Tsp_06847 [Trichinella spiralis]
MSLALCAYCWKSDLISKFETRFQLRENWMQLTEGYMYINNSMVGGVQFKIFVRNKTKVSNFVVFSFPHIGKDMTNNMQ